MKECELTSLGPFFAGQIRILEWAIEHSDQKALARNIELNDAYYY